ncbi:MAG TPA: phosphatase PAP2 family protein [Candidatus Saccharimonadia bacterium]|nr:phosphatase PAP2 family protein [Candidatus Saccharimonadia bacterium]
MIESVRERVKRFLAWRRSEPRTLEWFLGLGVLLLGFIEVADEVGDGGTHAFDEAVIQSLRNPANLADPLGPWWIEMMFKDITSLGGTAVLALITLFAIGYLLLSGKRANALLVFVAVVGGALLSHFLKLGFDRPRPELVAKLVEVRTLSFPSGHAMQSAVTYLTLGALLARVQGGKRTRAYLMAVAVILTLLIGFSRVFLGVHWPTDVLAGWCAGAAWALLCWLIARALDRHGDVEPASPPAPDQEPAPP